METSSLKQVSYWLDTAPAGDDYTTTPLADDVDVAVVGGGLTGLSAAIHLRRKGASVAVLEAERLGSGASGRNGGMCTTGLPISFTRAVARYGQEDAAELFRVFDAAIETVERLVSEESIDCGFFRWGKLALAYRESHFRDLEHEHKLLREVLSRDTVLVGRSDLRSELGSEYYAGGLVDPLGAGLHVGRFTRGLAATAARLGAHLHEDARAQTIQRTREGKFEIRTSRGTTRAGQVLVATNGYVDGAVPHLRRRIVPVGSFIVVTERLEEQLLKELMPTGRMASDTKNLTYYFRRTPDDRILFGGRARFTLSNLDTDLRSAEILKRGMSDVFPALRDRRIEYAWGGQVGITLDRMPHAGQHGGLFYSMGYNGHGVQIATHMGRQMVEVMDGHPEANPWRELRFRAVPFHFGPPWFLPLADVYYRWRDRIS